MGFAVTSYKDDAVGILSARIISLDQTLNFPESITQLQVDQDRYEMFKQPAEKIDSNLLSRFVDPINAAKQIVVDTGTPANFQNNYEVYSSELDAINKLNTIYGDYINPDGLYSFREAAPVLGFTGLGTHPPAGNFSVGTAVTDGVGGAGVLAFDFNPQVGVTTVAIIRAITGSFGIGNTLFFGGIGFGTPGTAYPANDTINFIGIASIYQDVVVQHVHPNLEPPDPGTDDIFGNSDNVILTSSNKGVGFANTFFPNGLNTSTSAPTPNLDSFVECTPAPPKLGEVYTFNTTSGSSQNTTISNNKTTVKDLRYGDPSSSSVGIGSFNQASVEIKKQKKSHAVNTWSGKRNRVVAGQSKAGFQAAIEVLTNPSYQE